ncbi:flippase [Amylibacter sp.]|nr:flippase [Amylibacter sp.]
MSTLDNTIIRSLFQSRFLLIERVIRLVVGLVVTVYVTRYLGPNLFGMLSFSLVILSFAAFLNHFGFPEILIREVTRKNDQFMEIVTAAISVRILGSLIFIFVMLLIIIFQKSDTLILYIILISALSFVFTSFDSIQTIFYVNGDLKKISLARLLGFAISNLVKLALVFINADLIFFAIPLILEAVVTSTVLSLFLSRQKVGSLVYPKLTLAISLIKMSLPLGLSVLIINLQLRVDQLMLKAFLSYEEVGIYAISVRIVELWYVIPTVISTSLLSNFVDLRIRDFDQYTRYLRLTMHTVFWMSVIFCTGCILLSGTVIPIIFGTQYARSAEVITVLCWCTIFASHGSIAAIWQIAEDKQKYRLIIQFISLILNIILNIILIPKFGIFGAAYATVISLLTITWFLPFCFKETRPLAHMMIASIFDFHYLIPHRLKNKE